MTSNVQKAPFHQHHHRLPSTSGICRGRTSSTASAGSESGGAAADIDRTSAQLEAIKQKSLDLDNRLPPVVHHFLSGSDSLDGDGSHLASAHIGVHQSRVPSKFFQQSSKQLEEMLAQRLEREAMHRAGAGRKGNGTQQQASSTSVTASATAAVQPSVVPAAGDSAATSVHKMLNDEMKRHCRIIQEKHLIERRTPQQVYAVGGAAASESIEEEMVS